MSDGLSKLTAARDALNAYTDSTECGICKTYAANILQAVEELKGLHERGAEFVRYTDECEMLKRIMVTGNDEQQTDDGESE
jgi:hypothetical protein